MVEVLKSNFTQLLPEILDSIKNACFIAFDTEFTGLSAQHVQFSLFDSLEERYQKLKQSASIFAISQLGLTMFNRERNKNVYSAKTYVFYLRPCHYGSNDHRFLLQASSIDFLTAYGFDFNKFLREGIPYLNDTEEKQAYKEWQDGSLNFHHGFNNLEEHKKITQWILTGTDSDELTIPLKIVGHEYFQLFGLRSRYPDIWAFIRDGKVILKKVKHRTREENSKAVTEEEISVFAYYHGFSSVIKAIQECKKILVGHNVLMDLLLIYNSFINPLPETLKEFKRNFNQAFPVVFDTKHIWSNIKKAYDFGKIMRESGLFALYEYLNNPPNHLKMLFSPSVEHEDSSAYDSDLHPHNAGYDSFIAGWVFIKLSHILAIKKTTCLEQVVPQSFSQHLKAMKFFENKVNISKAQVHFIDIVGEDKTSQRLQLLCIKSRNGMELNFIEMEERFKAYGFTELKRISNTEALLAVASFGVAKDVLRDFTDFELYSVHKYWSWRCWRPNRLAVFSSCIVSTIIGAWIIAKVVSSRK